MILAQWQETKGGIFHALKDNYESYYTQLFDTIQPKVLDNMLTSKYGLKTVLTEFEDIAINDFIDLLCFKLATVWTTEKQSIDNIINSYDVSTPIKTVRDISETKQSNTIDKAYSFDDDTAVNDSAKDSDDTIHRAEIESKSNVTPIVNIMDYFAFLDNHNFFDTIFKTIIDYMTLPIF